MEIKVNQKSRSKSGSVLKRLAALLMISIMVLGLSACKGDAAVPAAPEKMDISGEYQGTATITEAKSDALGEVTDMSFKIVQNDNGTATMTINDNTVEGTYDPKTGSFSMEHGFLWNLTFAPEEDTITAKGTMTTEETGEGFTQEVTLELERVGD
ncbi:hypothetical protein [Acidaminobacter hydrogenoformans]|uniref:Uncharacterized protein n=1 Tax=Acidaminobacter hydrogenoformans DSM 2784 TaxID=1120920 RepID=A0A1G5RR95_9FIRM|nr:hypothetical protein [Acidaminobacter hydrogenoformans]SCZ76378.1 hypothetical protein SAMN03080599_00206 [Acidaminobacter hydrogenoformans DSM 2784]